MSLISVRGPANASSPSHRGGPGVPVPRAGAVPGPLLGRLLRATQLRSQQEMTRPQALPLYKAGKAGFPVIKVLHN